MKRQAFLLLSDKGSPSVIKLYNSIKKISQKHGDIVIMFYPISKINSILMNLCGFDQFILKWEMKRINFTIR
jgi:hypothetical protein